MPAKLACPFGLAHLSAEEVQQKIQTATNFRQQQKWLVVYKVVLQLLTLVW
jgi:hypothetical protein